MVIIKIVVKYS